MTLPPTPLALKCPLCGARFRQSAACPRCGTDLTLLMRIAARAWAARQRCRAALEAADLASAFRHCAAASKLHRNVSDS
jgi:predicted amidophosphoribosyltransferase